MLRTALSNIRNQMRSDVEGDLSGVADAAAAGIMACNDASLTSSTTRGLLTAKSPARTRAAVRGLKSENDLVLVRHLQNTILRSALAVEPLPAPESTGRRGVVSA